MINVCTFTGHLGSAPEKKRAGESDIVRARLAVSQGKDKPTIWLDLDAWGDSFAARDLAGLQKGDRVTVAGRLQMREYDGKQYYTLRVSDLEAPRRDRPDERDGDPPARRPPPARRAPADRQHERREHEPAAYPLDIGDDDDVVF